MDREESIWLHVLENIATISITSKHRKVDKNQGKYDTKSTIMHWNTEKFWRKLYP